jgi:hypothetical protein
MPAGNSGRCSGVGCVARAPSPAALAVYVARTFPSTSLRANVSAAFDFGCKEKKATLIFEVASGFLQAAVADLSSAAATV